MGKWSKTALVQPSAHFSTSNLTFSGKQFIEPLKSFQPYEEFLIVHIDINTSGLFAWFRKWLSKMAEM